MFKLVFKITELLPYPTFILKDNNFIHCNNTLKNLLDTEIFNITYNNINKDIKINDINLNFSNNSYIINNKKYSIQILTETIDSSIYEIFILSRANITSIYNEIDSFNILKTIINNVPEVVFFKDMSGTYQLANDNCRKFYSLRGVKNIIGKKDIDLPINNNFIKTCKRNDNIVIERKKQLYINDRISLENGEKEILETIKAPVLDNDDNIIGIVGVLKDITEQKNLETKLKYIGYNDSLTGLYNRAYFNEKLDELIKCNCFPIKVIMGDVNGLKIINDTFGHNEGDNLIINIAEKLKEMCTNNEIIFRWGGDEFIILIPNCSDEQYNCLVKKLNKLKDNTYIDNYTLSMSTGSSTITGKDFNIDEILKEAENKLYRQKLLIAKSIRSSILSTLKESLQAKNLETEEHTKRIVDHCVEIGKKLNLNEECLNELTLVAKLHDIGKIGIPENILLKPDKLTNDEFEIIKTHSEKGYRLMLTLPELSHIARGVLTHHENYDGTGYPLGLSGNDIPLIARIVSVADAFDAMTHNRIYNKIKTKEEAINELKKYSGTQFDPNIVKIFCSII